MFPHWFLTIAAKLKILGFQREREREVASKRTQGKWGF